MYPRTAILLALSLAFLSDPQSSLAATAAATPVPIAAPVFSVVENFEGTKSLGNWSFYNGAEFPGATGALNGVTGRTGGYAARVTFEMASISAHYVEAICWLKTPVSTPAIAVWVAPDAGTQLSLRITDETNQTLQYTVSRPLEEAKTAGWYRSVVKLDTATIHWGGANDGAVHGKISSLGVVVEPLRHTDGATGVSMARMSGQVLFDDIAFMTPPVAKPAVVVENFTKLSGWQGAVAKGTGAVTVAANAKGYSGAGATVRYNVGAGASAIARKTLATAVSGSAVAFWMKGPAQVAPTLRLADAAGQTFDYALARLPGATQWSRYAVDLLTPSTHSGGANDGVFRGNLASIGLVLTPDAGFGSGSVDVDEITAETLFSWPIDSSAAPAVAASPEGAHPLDTVGINIHFTVDDAAMKRIGEVGFRWVRTDLLWHVVEHSAGDYDFAHYDRLVAEAEARGMSVLFILCYSNPLHTGKSDLLAPLATAEQLEAYGRYCFAAAAHFAGRPVSFEVWNEPNQTMTPAQYASILSTAETQVHAANPAAVLTSAGVDVTNFSFVGPMLNSGHAARANRIGAHPYTAGAPESLTDYLFLTRAYVAWNIASAPSVSCTESGYSSAWYGDGNAPEPRRRQAAFLARQLLSQFACDYRLNIVYEIRDGGTNPWEAEHNYGLLDFSYAPKPAFGAVKQLTSVFAARTVDGMLASNLNSLHAMKLHDSASTWLVLWSSASAPCRVETGRCRVAKGIDGQPIPMQELGGKSYVMVGDGPVYLQLGAVSL